MLNIDQVQTIKQFVEDCVFMMVQRHERDWRIWANLILSDEPNLIPESLNETLTALPEHVRSTLSPKFVNLLLHLRSVMIGQELMVTASGELQNLTETLPLGLGDVENNQATSVGVSACAKTLFKQALLPYTAASINPYSFHHHPSLDQNEDEDMISPWSDFDGFTGDLLTQMRS